MPFRYLSGVFFQLSQICRHIRSLSIEFGNNVSKGLKELILLQNNLESLSLMAYEDKDWTDIIPALTKHYNTLTTLYVYGDMKRIPLSFIASFINLQELVIAGANDESFEEFNALQHVIFSNLRILKIPLASLNAEIL